MQDSTAPGSAVPEHPKRSRRPAWLLAFGLGFLALLLLWQWYDGRSRMDALREEVARRLRDSDAESRAARLVARQAQDSVLESQAKLAQLELKFAESQNQQVALEALYQELSRSRDDWVLAEIEQILSIASQQLQLAGNVQAALAALQAADARLARSNRPQFAPLRKVFTSDIERLKTAPTLDVPGIAAKLDQLIAGVDALPLAQEAHPAAAEIALPRADAGILSRLWADFLGEMRQLVRVENIERPDPALLSPSQAFFLRENLKLRLLNARLALLARDGTTAHADLNTAAAWLERYFDVRSRTTATALAGLKQLGSGTVGTALPTIGDSLAAVRGFKASRERAR
jgi:uroporphyrin-III C-methyltransferase